MSSPLPTQRTGRFRVEATPELHAFIERTFVEPAPPEQRAAVRAEALHELAGAELVLEADGTLISSAHAQELLRVRLPEGAFEAPSFEFEKAPGLLVRVRWVDSDTLEALHPGKPLLTFRRV